MTRTPKIATVSAAVLALALTACSDGSETPDPTGSSSSETTSSSSPAAEPKDRSKQVFNSYTPPEIAASASGTMNAEYSSLPTAEVTFDVISVEATPDATILHYQLTSGEDVLTGTVAENWYRQPSLRVPGTHVRMQTLTASVPDLICVCTALQSMADQPEPQEVVYPPLPKDVDEIDVILQDLGPVTVPVTR